MADSLCHIEISLLYIKIFNIPDFLVIFFQFEVLLQ